MSKIKIWGWDKKQRTMIRFIKTGDIFCFKFDEKRFCFGRIITKTQPGHLAEFFNYISDKPYIDTDNIEKALRLMEPMILDSYSLFDRKREGEWRIIGHQEDYIAHDFDDIYLTFGTDNDWKKRDLYGNVTKISDEEHFKYIVVSPKGNYQVIRTIGEHMNSLNEI